MWAKKLGWIHINTNIHIYIYICVPERAICVASRSLFFLKKKYLFDYCFTGIYIYIKTMYVSMDTAVDKKRGLGSESRSNVLYFIDYCAVLYMAYTYNETTKSHI